MRREQHSGRKFAANGVLIAACSGALLILIFLALAVDGGFAQTARLRRLVTNSFEARAALQTVLTAHQDLELGQRGYIITGDAKFLEPYRNAELRIKANLDAFAALAGGGTEKDLVADLRSASVEKRRFVARTIELARGGQVSAAKQLIAGGDGKRAMDRIRSLVTTISEQERQKLDQRTAIANAQRAAVRNRALALQLGLIVLLAVAAVLVARSQAARNTALRRARDSAARQEIIFDSAKDGMIVLNPSGSIESLNPSAAAMFDCAAESLLRRDIGTLFEIAPDRSQIETFLRRLKANRRETYGQVQEFVGRRRDGATFPLEVSVSPVRLADQTLFLAVIRDISERREVEQLKGEFVATVSHELRTPLTSIAGSLGLINGGAAGDVPPKISRLVQIAHNNATRLVRLINDILDIEKIEAGRMQFDVGSVALAPLLDEAVHQTAGYADEFGVIVRIEPVAPDVRILADEDRLMQVMTNLLSNAIKYSPRGETVVVKVEPLDRRYRISVVDRGAGIPEAFQSRIFGKFAQADSSDSRQKGGTGLGLSIVREIVVRLGGSVSFDSQEGQGASFHVDLPAVHPSGLASSQADQGRVVDKSLPIILHVEDDPDMQAVVASAFDGKAAVHSTSSIADARTLIRRERFDAAILDVAMLDGSGTDLVPLLRKRLPDLPVIIFTAQEVDGVAGQGIDLVLVKSRASLDHLVHETIARIDARSPAAGGGK